MKKPNRFVSATSSVCKTGCGLTLVTFLLATEAHTQALDRNWFSECPQGDMSACNSIGIYYEQAN